MKAKRSALVCQDLRLKGVRSVRSVVGGLEKLFLEGEVGGWGLGVVVVGSRS